MYAFNLSLALASLFDPMLSWINDGNGSGSSGGGGEYILPSLSSDMKYIASLYPQLLNASGKWCVVVV